MNTLKKGKVILHAGNLTDVPGEQLLLLTADEFLYLVSDTRKAANKHLQSQDFHPLPGVYKLLVHTQLEPSPSGHVELEEAPAPSSVSIHPDNVARINPETL